MYRGNTFENLLWNEVDTHHRQGWNRLQDYYGFSGSEFLYKDLKPQMENQKDILSVLTENCVYSCRELLFSLEPIDNLRKDADRYGDTPDFTPITRSAMANALSKSLSDHLILTFAYRFFCDNLKARSLRWYSDALYDFQHTSYYGLSAMGEKAGVTAEKWDAYKNWNRKYDAFIRQTVDLAFRDAGENGDPSVDGTKESKKKFVEWLQTEFDKGSISPPASWFLLFLLSERIQFRKIFLEETKNRYTPLVELVSRTGFVTTVLPICEWKKGSNKPMPHKLLPMQDGENAFVGIPVPVSTSNSFQIPSIDYELVEGAGTLKISDRLQMVFNNYLFERNFHLHTVASMENAFSRFQIAAIRESGLVKSVFNITELRAPIVQAAVTSFVGTNAETIERPELIERYIDRWNNHALPVLEALFVWSVWENFKTPIEVATAIDNWVAPESTYERLKMIRLLRTKECVSEVGDNQLYNEIVSNVFARGDNLDCYRGIPCASSNVPEEIYFIRPRL